MPASDLKLISSMATRDVLAELIAIYERQTHLGISTEAAGGVDVAKRVQGGERLDLVVLASNAIDKLIADGKLLAGSRVDLVRSGIAVAVPAGAPRPDISTEAGVERAVRGAKSLSYSTGPSGVYLEKLFERWGILADLRSRIVVPPPGVAVGSLIAQGTVHLGFQQLSELLTLPGIDVIGLLPPEIQNITIFSGGIAVACARPDAARAVLKFLASPAAAPIKGRHGMESASPGA
jgi:molybdate transport system substrate-binding protein